MSQLLMLNQSYFHTMKFNLGDYGLGDPGLGDFNLDFDLIPCVLYKRNISSNYIIKKLYYA